MARESRERLGAAKQQERRRPSKTEIIIALVGFAGVLVTAVFSNWDKIFPQEELIQATYSGYRPTGIFETELRYNLEITGVRKLISSRVDFISKKYNANYSYEDFLKVVVPIYQKYYTVKEMQELNKFYSTQPMLDMTQKQPLISKDIELNFSKYIQQLIDR